MFPTNSELSFPRGLGCRSRTAVIVQYIGFVCVLLSCCVSLSSTTADDTSSTYEQQLHILPDFAPGGGEIQQESSRDGMDTVPAVVLDSDDVDEDDSVIDTEYKSSLTRRSASVKTLTRREDGVTGSGEGDSVDVTPDDGVQRTSRSPRESTPSNGGDTNKTETPSNHSTPDLPVTSEDTPVVTNDIVVGNETVMEVGAGNSTSNETLPTMNITMVTTEEPSYLDKLGGKFRVLMHNHYVIGVVLPVGVGVCCGLAIICVVCCIRRVSRRARRTKKYKNLKVHENLKGMDEMLLLGESSEDEF